MEAVNKTPLWAKIVIAILIIVCLEMVVTLGFSYFGIRSRDAQIEQLNAELDEKQRIIDDEIILVEEFMDKSKQYGLSTRFLQSFFDDKIVYFGENGLEYRDIDTSLPMNTYDLDNIVSENGRISYTDDNGVTGRFGIDVSEFQGDIDWAAVKNDGVEYAFIRAGYRGYGSEGNIVADSKFEQNMAGASAAGVETGVYFYSQAINEAEAVEEAEFVINALQGKSISYPVVFDMEVVGSPNARTASLTAGQITDITIAFCERVKQAGYEPLIYGNIMWMMDKLNLSEVTEYGKWFAQYTDWPNFPYEYDFWQYSRNGTVNGIEGDVDLNVYFDKTGD